jgi:diacylglycerol kinase (ATP)
MPSGHTALSFSLWVAITLMTEIFSVSLGTFILAFLVARSRINAGVHTPTEVAAGALIGAGITFVLFRVFL